MARSLKTLKNPTPDLGCPYRGTDETSSYATQKPHGLGGCNLSDDGMADEGMDRFWGRFGETKTLEFLNKKMG